MLTMLGRLPFLFCFVFLFRNKNRRGSDSAVGDKPTSKGGEVQLTRVVEVSGVQTCSSFSYKADMVLLHATSTLFLTMFCRDTFSLKRKVLCAMVRETSEYPYVDVHVYVTSGARTVWTSSDRVCVCVSERETKCVCWRQRLVNKC